MHDKELVMEVLRQIEEAAAKIAARFQAIHKVSDFTDNPAGNDVHETKEISENIYIDIDAKGNLVGMTIEHAKANANLWEFSFQEMAQQTA